MLSIAGKRISTSEREEKHSILLVNAGHWGTTQAGAMWNHPSHSKSIVIVMHATGIFIVIVVVENDNIQFLPLHRRFT